MSLKGNVCFLEVYHYTSNAILALPISGFSDEKVFAAYTKQYGLLQSKGFDIKLNVMENQPSKIIKQYLTPKQCNLMLVEPNIHHANVAERAIQAFIDNFFSALATTESGFLLQLWDCLAPLVETSLSMQRPSHIDPTKLAYEVIHGPYHWNCFPLAPPECNAVIYEPPKARTLCGSCGIDAWCVGPLLDHYRCEHFFVPETCGYFISGLAKLFPQHCHIPFLMWNKHLQEVINELVTTLNKLPLAKQTHILTKVQQWIVSPMRDHNGRALTHKSNDWLLPPGDIQHQQCISLPEQRVEQRVTEDTMDHVPDQRMPTPIPQITDTPAIMTASNPTAPRHFKNTKRKHLWTTCNNIPGSVPPIVNTANQRPIMVDPTPIPVVLPAQQSPRTPVLNTCIPRLRFVPIKGGLWNQKNISQEAIDFLTKFVRKKSPDLYTLNKLKPTVPPTAGFDFQQVAMPMVHPTTGETISSYKKLMHDPATVETWQTAFSKDFGRMVQDDKKTGQRGTNSIFVMSHAEG